jgi:hypothetical protein
MLQHMFCIGEKMASRPIAATFGAFLSSCALADYFRPVELTDEEMNLFKQREYPHLGDSLEQLHSKAFFQAMTFNCMRVNRNRCIELYFLHKRGEEKKLELKHDPEFKDITQKKLEEDVSSEFCDFGQRMCRTGMIRNFYLVKWFKALVQDEVVKFYLIPVTGYFGIRYYNFLNCKTKGTQPQR